MNDLWMSLRFIVSKRGESALAVLGTALAVAVLAATVSLIGAYDAVFARYAAQPQARQITVENAYRTLGEGEAATRVDATAERNVRLSLTDAAGALAENPDLAASYLANYQRFTTAKITAFGGLGGREGLAAAVVQGAGGGVTTTVTAAGGAAASATDGPVNVMVFADGGMPPDGAFPPDGFPPDAAVAPDAAASAAAGAAGAAGNGGVRAANAQGRNFDFEAMRAAAQAAADAANAEITDEPLLEEIQGIMASPSYFDAYELKLDRGTLFDDRDVSNATAIAVVGAGLEKKLFADGTALDKKIRLNGTVYRIAGVLKPYAYSSEGLPSSFDDLIFVPTRNNRGGPGGGFFGSADSLQFAVKASGDAAAAARNLEASFAKLYGEGKVTAVAQIERIRSELDKRRRILSLLATLAAAVGVAAAVNIFNLMTGRVSRRAASIAIQRSLGASALRVFRQTLIESGLLAFAGALIGAAAAPLVAGALGGLLEGSGAGSQTIELALRWDLVALTAAAAVLAAFVFAAPPAANAAGTMIVDALRDE
jgi:putative ABC transport system permease protein